ncbi:MAG: hypothetical protein PUE80_05800 [bacterium]|nr:hypothetical protein [bacterium]
MAKAPDNQSEAFVSSPPQKSPTNTQSNNQLTQIWLQRDGSFGLWLQRDGSFATRSIHQHTVKQPLNPILIAKFTMFAVGMWFGIEDGVECGRSTGLCPLPLGLPRCVIHNKKNVGMKFLVFLKKININHQNHSNNAKIYKDINFFLTLTPILRMRCYCSDCQGGRIF